MQSGSGWGVAAAVTTLGALSLLPGVVGAQPVDTSVFVDGPGVVRAVASFVAVGVAGAAFLLREEAFVDRAVDDTMERPMIAVVYGLIAFVLALFLALFVTNLVASFGVAGTPISYVASVVLIGGVVIVGGLGYLVVGTLLTDVLARRQPWQGLLAGATLSALGWLALPTLPGLGAWVLVAAIGVGGPTRTWLHRERPVESESDA